MIISQVKTKDFIKKNAVLFMIVISYMLIGVILLSALSYIISEKYAQNSIKDIKGISQKMLSQLHHSTDTLWKSIYNYLYGIYLNDNVLNYALCGDTYTAVDLDNIGKRMNEITRTNSYIQSVYAYNTAADLMISTISSATQIDEFYDKEIVGLLKGEGLQRNPTIIYRTMNYDIGAINTKKNVISVVFTDRDSENKLIDALIFNIDQDVLQNMIENNNMADESGIVFVMTKDRQVISHPMASMVNKKIPDESYIKNIIESKNESGYFISIINGKKFLVSYRKTEKMGWIFVSIAEYDKLILKVMELQSTVLLLTLIFILISILLAVFFIKKIYFPLHKLLMKFKFKNRNSGLNTALNEYETLTDIYSYLVEDLKKLEKFKSDNNVVIKNEILKNIFHGKYSSLNLKEGLTAEYGLKLESPYILVLLFCLDSYAEIYKENSKEDIGIYRFAVCKIAEELFSPSFIIETYDSGDDNIGVIINLNNSSGDCFDMVESIAVKVQSAVREFFYLTVSIGIGTIEQTISGLSKSYSNAMSAVSYRIKNGINSIMKYEDVYLTNQCNYEYPVSIEKKILDSLKAGEKSKIVSNLNDFAAYIKDYSPDEIMLSFMQLAMMMIRIAKHLDDTGDIELGSLNMNYEKIFELLNSCDTIELIRERLELFVETILRGHKTRKACKSDEVIKKVIEYIDRHYNDTNMSVDTIAETVQLSPNYLRMIYSENTGKSLSSYINEYRIGKFKELLITTDYPVSRIAEMLGMTGGNYFYTAFKKAVGKSPDEYRREYAQH